MRQCGLDDADVSCASSRCKAHQGQHAGCEQAYNCGGGIAAGDFKINPCHNVSPECLDLGGRCDAPPWGDVPCFAWTVPIALIGGSAWLFSVN